MESSGIEIRDNILLGNPACIGFRNLRRDPASPLRDIRIRDNLCGRWTYAGIATGIGDWDGWTASAQNVSIDEGRYLAVPDLPVFHWLGVTATTLEEAAEERTEENTSELQSLMRQSYAVLCST